MIRPLLSIVVDTRPVVLCLARHRRPPPVKILIVNPFRILAVAARIGIVLAYIVSRPESLIVFLRRFDSSGTIHFDPLLTIMIVELANPLPIQGVTHSIVTLIVLTKRKDALFYFLSTSLPGPLGNGRMLVNVHLVGVQPRYATFLPWNRSLTSLLSSAFVRAKSNTIIPMPYLFPTFRNHLLALLPIDLLIVLIVLLVVLAIVLIVVLVVLAMSLLVLLVLLSILRVRLLVLKTLLLLAIGDL